MKTRLYCPRKALVHATNQFMKNNKIASENTIRRSLLKTLFLDQSIKFIPYFVAYKKR